MEWEAVYAAQRNPHFTEMRQEITDQSHRNEAIRNLTNKKIGFL